MPHRLGWIKHFRVELISLHVRVYKNVLLLSHIFHHKVLVQILKRGVVLSRPLSQMRKKLTFRFGNLRSCLPEFSFCLFMRALIRSTSL